VIDLSIIIVNWNSAEYLEKCVRSIYSCTSKVDYEIIVVDNASYDGSDELIKDDFSGVKFIQSKENLGFAKANNLGYHHSKGRNLLFLNPDTEIIDSAIDKLYFYLESIPDAGAIGCKLLNSDLSLDTSCVQPFPSILNQALDAEYFKTRFPKVKLWSSNPFIPNQNSPVEVEVIIGACIMIRRNLFDKLGMFSTDYFMYAEDLDLCYKVRQAGYKTYYVSEAEIIHHGGGSTKTKQKNDFKIIMMRESVLRFIKKTKGGIYSYLYRLTTILVAICRLFLIAILIGLEKNESKKKALNFSFYKWKKILTWSIGLETWLKEYY